MGCNGGNDNFRFFQKKLPSQKRCKIRDYFSGLKICNIGGSGEEGGIVRF